jgi:hypothetical protein
MVAFEAEPPVPFSEGSPKIDTKYFLIALLGFPLLDVLQDLLQAHDRVRLDDALSGQRGRQQRLGQMLLGRRHFAQRHAFPIFERDEMPVQALFRSERNRRLCA